MPAKYVQEREEYMKKYQCVTLGLIAGELRVTEEPCHIKFPGMV